LSFLQIILDYDDQARFRLRQGMLACWNRMYGTYQ